ncbi:hypothetical protein AB0L88_37755 [Saccharopolyspora shandongensis]|uniref:hypothetical protein n=1 Tax=Saccharopolyspora shandongensis TaxID=418495 RepID=UPI00342C0C53
MSYQRGRQFDLRFGADRATAAIYADRAGAVVIPAHSVRDVLTEAQHIQAEDEDFLAQIRNEDPSALRTGRRFGRQEL